MRPEFAIRNDEGKVPTKSLKTRIREEEREKELAEGGQWLGPCLGKMNLWRRNLPAGNGLSHIMRDMAITRSGCLRI